MTGTPAVEVALSKQNPDPTTLTQDAVDRLERTIRDVIDGDIAVLTQRMFDNDKAAALRLSAIDHIPDRIDEKVAAVMSLTSERFAGVQQQFALNALALAAALSASEKQVSAALLAQQQATAKQDESNQKAIDKSEVATSKTIETNSQLATTRLDALAKSLDEVKLAVTSLQAVKQGSQESRTGIYAAIAAVGGILGIVLIVAAALATRPSP